MLLPSAHLAHHACNLAAPAVSQARCIRHANKPTICLSRTAPPGGSPAREVQRWRQRRCAATSSAVDNQELTEENIEEFVNRALPQDAWAQDDSDWASDIEPKEACKPHEAVAIMKLGSWRLAGVMSSPLEALAAQIESAWRHLLGPPRGDMGLYPLPQEWKYCDSLDPDHTWEAQHYGQLAYRDLPSPEAGEPGYPRLMLENRMYQTRVFRKLHMELGARQGGFEVLHCVMYPRMEYDLPILSMDMVAINGRVSLAIIDPCPVSKDRSLQPIFVKIARELQERYGMSTNRAIPAWGQAIFSDQCIALQPKTPLDVSNFVKYAIALSRAFLQVAKNATPVQHNSARASRLADIRTGHERYCAKMLENSKTRRVLESAFSPEFADEYMAKVMFDFEEDVVHA